MDRPNDKFVIKQTLADSIYQSPEVIWFKKLNLDEDEKLEVVYLVRNGQEEHISVFKSLGEDNWNMEWKKSYTLINLGGLFHSPVQKKWVPVQENKTSLGYVVKNIEAVELPGDTFLSLFVEILSEDPSLGIFSVPMGYRKGSKILDGLSNLIDHPSLRSTKRSEFEYNPKNKSILVFPKDRNYGLEFIFNGFEMIPNLNSQPIPSIIKFDKQEKKYRIELKNRGGFSTTTYITLSIPQGGVLKALTESNLRAYNQGKSIFSKTKGKYIPAIYPMIEATKQSWGTNFRYAFDFEYEGDADYLLFRISYMHNRNVETIPNSFSVVPIEVDQQGFLAYRLNLPK